MIFLAPKRSLAKQDQRWDADPLGLAPCEQIPCFLFRAYFDQSGGTNFQGLNTAEAITPSGFKSGLNHRRASDMSNFEAHFSYHESTFEWVPTALSSWTSSILMALAICNHKDDDGETNISIDVLDTAALPRDVENFFATTLANLLNYDYCEARHGLNLRLEYLTHGVIDGKYYVSIPYEVILDLNLLKLFPELVD